MNTQNLRNFAASTEAITKVSLATLFWSPSILVLTTCACWVALLSIYQAFLLLRKDKTQLSFAARLFPDRDVILDNIPGLIMVSDPLGHLIYVNRRILDYTGLTFDQINGEGWLQTVHPADVELLRDHWVKAIIGKTPITWEYRWRRSDGAYRRFRVDGNAVCTDDVPEGLWYSSLHDVEDHRTFEERQDEAQSVLNESRRFATVAEMAATIAHEINQPLMAVMTNAAAGKAWLTGQTRSAEQAVEAFDRIERDAGSAGQVVARIRSLFKRIPLQKCPVNIADVVEEVSCGLDGEIRRRSARMQVVIPRTLPQVEGDPIQLRQVFHNLLQNALEAMDEVSHDRRVLEIEAQAHPDRRMVEVAVRDLGVGSKDVERIFDAFVSTKASGLGIGLSISRSIMEGHGGSLRAERRYPNGMTFMLNIPSGE